VNVQTMVVTVLKEDVQEILVRTINVKKPTLEIALTPR